MKEFFLELYDYNHFMNTQLIECLVESETMVSDRSRKLISHIVSAHHIWNCRIENKPADYAVWDLHGFHDLKFIDRTNFEISCIILDNTPADKVISYKTSRGESYSNNVKDILFHVLNHSNYHRGQIAQDIKASGITPPVTDYIFYKR